ncbi:PRK06770 family protein [Bacillus cereus]|uniref:PRK06770 family protein n=1 Tax=Bacillus cereus TaxID=1396 RepID=UPI00345BE374|nr:PRK06770 family protein [Bacillus cereus]
MDKKLTYWLASIIGVVVLATGMTYGMLQFAEVPLESEDHVFAEVNKEDILSNEAEVISAMHSMTHQKVKACEGKGATPMTKKNAEKVRNILNGNNFKNKEELLAITERWANRDFSEILEEHNYFIKLQGGKIGEATVMDKVDEQVFCFNTFGDDVTAALFKSGDLQAL